MLWLPLLFQLILGTEALLGLDLGGLLGVNKEPAPKTQHHNTKPHKTTHAPSTDTPDTIPDTDNTICGHVPKSCEDSEYRSYDGTCNNLENSWWGAANMPYKRVFLNSYSDGVHAFPKSVTGKELPGARKTSMFLYSDVKKPDPFWTLLFMQTLQALSHDVSKTMGTIQISRDPIICCSNGKLTDDEKTNDRCASITIPHDDENYEHGRRCMDFLRTITTHDLKCKDATKVAEPVNAVTPLIDGSIIYGSDIKTANDLRAHKGGLLKYAYRDGRMYLPQHPQSKLACKVDNATEPCYTAGDIRVNQNPQLNILHQMYLTQHNSIAKELAKLNSHWDDEKLFQETRKIVIGMFQHVIYYELLPGILGMEYMKKNKLNYPDATECIDDYDPNVNAAPSNAYAAAAFRIFHTFIVGSIDLYTENRKKSQSIMLHEWMLKPSICEQGNNFIEFSSGLLTQPQSAMDLYHTDEILNYMPLKVAKEKFGSDLKAIDIQRNREQGVCPYTKVLEILDIAKIKSFNDFKQLMSDDNVKKLKDTYASPHDVDLVVGLGLEDLVPRTLCGPTLLALLGEQFLRSRIADRYFYENCETHCFTSDQRTEIRKSTMASFMCYSSELKHIQERAFELVSDRNPLKKCSDIYQFDPTPWKEDDDK